MTENDGKDSRKDSAEHTTNKNKYRRPEDRPGYDEFISTRFCFGLENKGFNRDRRGERFCGKRFKETLEELLKLAETMNAKA